MSIEVNSFIDLGLKIDETNNNPKNILLLGNTKGFFGSCSEDKNILTNSCGDEETIKNNYFWLENEYNVCNSNLYIIGNTDVCNYYHHIISDMASMMGKKPKYKYMDINICAKKKGISEEKEIERYYVNILKEQRGKRMKFDKIIMNPPYDNGLGGKITVEAISLLKDGKDCVCLMPLSNYKNKSAELWRKVKTFELADPKLFVDADITKNLCICTLENKNVDKYSWEDMQFESFDKRYIEFYKRNKELPSRYVFRRCDNATAEEFDFETQIVESNRLPFIKDINVMGGFNGFRVGSGVGYRLNIQKNIQDLPNGLCVLDLYNKISKDNFCKFAYTDNPKNLVNKLLFGLNLKTVSNECSIAIPQINWETISDNPLWKKGDYDGAVLDVMGLKWDEEKNTIVRRINT